MTRLMGLTALLALLALAACRVAPVQNIESAPLSAPEFATMEDVADAVIRAGLVQGWEMREIRPGLLEARLLVGGRYQARVDIFFDTEAFSIVYKDSVNLRYNGSTIHQRYNQWVSFLKAEIQKQMRALKPGQPPALRTRVPRGLVPARRPA